MKNKDTQLLEEAYQQVFEANFLTKAINKGKEMIGMGPSNPGPSNPLTLEQAKQQYIKGMTDLGLESGETHAGGAAASYENLRCPWFIEADVKPPRFKLLGGFAESNMTWPENKELPDPAGALTDKNLNAILKQTKQAIGLTKKRLDQIKKEAPEREKREKEFQDRAEQSRKDNFWAQRARSVQDTKLSGGTYS